jgi:S-DNA-T family DNA segregation ATPase FtsK/SpoIIIE
MQCSHCGHNNPPPGDRCEACGIVLRAERHTAYAPMTQAAPISVDAPAHPTPAGPTPAAAVTPGRTIRGVLVELGGAGSIYRVYEGKNTIGRDPDSSEIVLNESRISKLHAIVVVDKDQAYVLDVASANGTRVNGAELRSDKASLPTQSVLQFGSRAFAFLFIPKSLFAHAG